MRILGGNQRLDRRFAFRKVADAERVDQRMDRIFRLQHGGEGRQGEAEGQ